MEAPFKILDDSEAAHGERIASITGSILQQLEDYQDSVSGQESAVRITQFIFSLNSGKGLHLLKTIMPSFLCSQDLNNSMEMSICKSENLFSPLVDNQPDLPVMSTFSTDSLDVRSDILATCATTNHNNYTIAFNGNNILEESYNTLSSAYRTANGITPSTTSDKLNENDHRFVNPSDNNKKMSNNNGSSNSSSSQWTVDNTSHLFTQSCPNVKVLWTRRRIFDIGTRRRPLYQRDESTELSQNGTGSRGTSTGTSSSIPMSSDESVNNLHFKSRLDLAKPTTTAEIAEIIKKSIQIQTSYSSNASSRIQPPKIGTSQSTPVYICYPNYTLPDLNFLSEKPRENSKKDVFLIPQQYKIREKRVSSAGYSRTKRPMSCNDIEELRRQDLSHIRDWPSLHFLLPDEYRTILKDLNLKYEENNEDEKSSEVGMGLDSPVVMRKKLSSASAQGEKRFSLNMGAGHGGKSSRRYSKRFSLQEPIIPEINEITNEINRVLNEMEPDFFESPATGEVGSSSETGVPVPHNTPKISFIDHHDTGGVTMRTIQNSATRMSRMSAPNLTEKQCTLAINNVLSN